MEQISDKNIKISLAETRKKRAESLKLLIPDRATRDLIFEFDESTSDFLADKKRYLDYFKNILYLTVLITYKKFIQFKVKLNNYSKDDRSKAIDSFPNAFVRIYNLFDDCYNCGRLEFQFVEDVILNLQIDASISGDDGFIKQLGLQGFFNFQYIGNNLSKYIFLLKKSIFSSKQQADFSLNDLEMCIRAFPFLRDVKVSLSPFYDSSYFSVVTLEYLNEKIPLEELLVVTDEQIFILGGITIEDARMLSSSNKQKEQSITAEYSVPLGRENFYIHFFDGSQKSLEEQTGRHFIAKDLTLIEDILLKYRILNTRHDNDDGILWRYSFIDNKYIKYLALNISDCLNKQGKNWVYDTYKDQYSDIFKRFNTDGIIHWDEIVVFLLLEVGIYKFLYFFFKNTHLRYDDVKAAFRLRFGENVSKLEEQYELIRDPIGVSALKNDESKSHTCVQALILLAGKLLTANEVDIPFNNGMGALSEIRDNIRNGFEKNTLRSDEKILFFANQLINLNNFIFIFYKGLLEYYAIEKNQDIEESDGIIFGDNSRQRGERVRFETFRKSTLQARRNIYDKYNRLIQIKTLDSNSLNDLICMVSMSFNDIEELNENISATNSSENIRFYDMTGRNKLFEQSDFDSARAGVLDALQSTVESRKQVKLLYDAITSYINYLMDGAWGRETNIEGAIYPVLGVCSSSVISRDGYRYSYLSVFNGEEKSPTDNGEEKSPTEIKIVSNVALKTGELYYCVPNVNRCFYSQGGTAHRIWMNPQLINMKATFERLQFVDDYFETASLIFQSDKELYTKLFGGQENAVKVLSKLFEMRGSPYHKDNVRILRLPPESNSRGQIVAVATFYSELPKWDSDIMEGAFRVSSVEIPATYESACESLKDTFSDVIGNNYYINDVCVHPDYRGRGYAKYLLNSLIKVAEKQFSGKNIVLTVYENNSAALGLYNLMGFISYVAAYDNHGNAQGHSEKYYKMIKYI